MSQPPEWAAPGAGDPSAGQPAGGHPGQYGYPAPGGAPPPPGYDQQPVGPPGYGQPAGPPGYAPYPSGRSAAFAAKPGIIALRPLGLGDILDGALGYVRSNPRATLGLSAIVAVIGQLVLVLPQYLVFSGLETLGTSTAEPEVSDVIGTLGAGGLGFLVALVVNVVGTVLVTGMLIVVLHRAVLGRKATIGETWDAVRPRLLGLIGLSLLVALAQTAVFTIGIGLIVLLALTAPVAASVSLGILLGFGTVAAVVYLYVAWSLAAPAYILENIGVVAALGRSRALVGGAWWRTFGILLLAAVIVGVIAQIIAFPLSLTGSGLVEFGSGGSPSTGLLVLSTVITGAGAALAAAITQPFSAGVVGLLYLDRRIRREGMDVELANAAAAGAGGPQPFGAHPYPTQPYPPQQYPPQQHPW